MSKSQELKDKIINNNYKGTLYPDFEQVLASIVELENLSKSLKLDLLSIHRELTNKEEKDFQETIEYLDSSIDVLADKLFLEDEHDDKQ